MIDDNITIFIKHDHGKTEDGGIRSVGVLLRTVPMSDRGPELSGPACHLETTDHMETWCNTFKYMC